MMMMKIIIIIPGAIPPELYRFSYTVYSMQSERLDQEKPILEKPTHLKAKSAGIHMVRNERRGSVFIRGRDV